MNEIHEEETADMKNSTKQKTYKKHLTLLQKTTISIFLIILLIFLYNMNTIKNYLIENPNKITPNLKNNKNVEKPNPKNRKLPQKTHHKKKPEKKDNSITESKINEIHAKLKNELKIPILSEINKKRTFEKRYPLPKEIKCQEHLREGGLLDMMVFTSFLTKNITFFEFASGCSTIIAKYYAKKAYAVEGNIKWYNIGVKNGLKDNLLFRDLKCDGSGSLLSWPGKKSTMNDWKNFFQAYKKEYNADVIFIDGRFRVACAFDVYNKIKNDTVVLLHECSRTQYSVIKNYYDLVYHWGRLCMFKKKANISEIPLEVQKQYWDNKI